MRLPTIAAVALLPLGLVADRVVFAPEEGSTLTKTFDAEIQVDMDDLSVAVGGQEIDPAMLGDPEVSFLLSLHTVVTDEYGAVEDGRPSKLTRTYDEAGLEVEVSASSSQGSEDETTTATSLLEGLSVLFSWDEDEEDFVAAFAGDEEGDEELLEDLDEDMDLRFLLPDGEVSEGDSWSIDPDTLSRIVAPGGDLAYEPEDSSGEEIPEEIADALEEVIAELFQGEATATYKGEREDDGTRIGLIEVAVEIDANADVSEIIGSALSFAEEDMGGSLDLADVQVSFEGEGVLSWDLDANRVQAFELSGDAVVAIDVEASSEMMGSMELSVEFSGSMSFATSVE